MSYHPYEHVVRPLEFATRLARELDHFSGAGPRREAFDAALEAIEGLIGAQLIEDREGAAARVRELGERLEGSPARNSPGSF